MKIDIWSDIVCPFCYIGKRHLEQALERFPGRDAVQIQWHSFELDPNTPRNSQEKTLNALMTKYGKSRPEAEDMMAQVQQMGQAAGLDLQLSQTLRNNTFDAHRLLHLAAEYGLQTAAKERLLKAYFSDGQQIADSETLIRLLSEVGLPTEAIQAVLNSDNYAQEVRVDQKQAREIGISGVPFFVFDGRYAVSGAQPPAVFEELLKKVQAENQAQPLQTVAPAAQGCTDADCELPSA